MSHNASVTKQKAKIPMKPNTHHAADPSRVPLLRQIPFMSLHHIFVNLSLQSYTRKFIYICSPAPAPTPHEMTSIVIFTKIVAKTYLENNES
jgi:hypothetical protein